jgi:uncharacterized protein (TIGR03083 family)
MAMDEDYWAAVRSMRLDIAELLGSLAPGEWDEPSLCRGWRVRDVAGHVAVVPTITTWQMVSVAPRAGLDPNRINTLVAIREGARRPEEIVALLRERAASKGTAKMLDARNSLFDVIVHSQDIALPLGRDLPVPVEPTRRGLERVWEMGWPFRARRRMAGVTLRATDIAWRVGDGPEVTGPALALLLLLTGRRDAASAHLVGPGLASLDATA